MPLTPIDVQQKTFGTALRGYDLDEVDDFLDDIVTSLKDYEQRLRDAQERISTLELEMTDRGDAEGAIARALVAAQRSADSIISEAKVEAERIISDAESEASEMSQARDEEKAKAEAEIGRIRGVVEDLRSRLSELVTLVGADVERLDGAISTATAKLEPAESVEAAVSEYEEPQSAWEEPAAVDDIEDFADSDDSDDSDDEELASTSHWSDDDQEEPPVRPWEVG